MMPTAAMLVSSRLGGPYESLTLTWRVLSRSAVALDPLDEGSAGGWVGAVAVKGDGSVGEVGDETGEGRPCSTLTPWGRVD